jgi:hypothetical protein
MAIYFGQIIATKLTQANAYFAVDNHIQAVDWSKCTDNEKKAGLLQAEREVNLYLGTDLEYNFSATSWPADWNLNFRPDYAVFEHAIFILGNTARTNGNDASGAEMIESADYQRQEMTQGVGMSPQATRFLQMNRSQIERG